MVRKRGGRYQATVRLDGRRFWGTFEREANAWAWIDTLKADAVRGVLKVEAKPRELRFDDLCRLYRIHKAPRWRHGTAQYFDCHVEGVLLPAFGRRPIATLRAEEIQGFLDARLATVAGSTANKYHQVLTAVLRYAVRMGYLERSPMAAVERARSSPKPARSLRLHELQAVLGACPPDQAPFFTILALTGLRRSEMFRLSWDWCDFEAEKILIREAKRGSNEMPMSARVKAALLDVGPRRGGRVFPGFYRDRSGQERSDATKMLTDKRRALRLVLDRAGVDPSGISTHTFRHTFCTLIEEIPGVSYSVARALARHGAHTGDITARYLHPSDETLRSALAQLEARVFGPSNVVQFPRHAQG